MCHSWVVKSWWTVPHAFVFRPCVFVFRNWTLAVMVRARDYHGRSKIAVLLLYRELLWFRWSFKSNSAFLFSMYGLFIFYESLNRRGRRLWDFWNTFWLIVFVSIVWRFFLWTKSSPKLLHDIVFFIRTRWLASHFKSCLLIFCKHRTWYWDLVLVSFVECGALLVPCIYRGIVIWAETSAMVVLLDVQFFFYVILIWIFYHVK